MFFFRRGKKTCRFYPAAQTRRFVRRPPLSLEVLESRILLDAYQWVGGSGNWDNSNNWHDLSTGQSNSVPGSGDTADINTSNPPNPPNPITITIPSGYQADVQSLTTGSNDTLSIQGGSLTVTAGKSTLSGALWMSGGSITATGSGVSLKAGGSTRVSGASLYASGGATLSLPQMTSYTADNNTFQADSGGTLDVSALTTTTLKGKWNINTSDASGEGGTVNLSGLSSLSGSSAGTITINDTGSGNELALGTQFTKFSGVKLTLDSLDLQTAAKAWTTITNSHVTISGVSYSLSGLNDVDGSMLNLSNGGNLTLGSSTTPSSFSADNTTIKVDGTSSLSLGSSATPALNGDWTIDASSGAQFNFPSVTNVSGTGSVTLTFDYDTNSPTSASLDLSELSNQSVTVGQTATFTILASGNSSPTIQWQRSTDDGKTWSDIDGATDATLKLNNVSLAMNGYQYRAVISSNNFINADGSAFSIASDAATLTVGYAPSVTTNPNNQTVNAGQNANFTAAANGIPAPTVQWQVSTDGGKTFSNISGATSTKLTLTSVTAAMNGNEYQAVLSNSLGNTTTSVAALTVEAAVSSQTTAITSPFQALVAIYLDLEALTSSSDPAVLSYLNSISESMLGQPLPPVADLVPVIEADFAELVNLLLHAV